MGYINHVLVRDQMVTVTTSVSAHIYRCRAVRDSFRHHTAQDADTTLVQSQL